MPFAFQNKNLYLTALQDPAFRIGAAIVNSPATVNTQIDTGIICLALIAQYLRLPADPEGIRHDDALICDQPITPKDKR